MTRFENTVLSPIRIAQQTWPGTGVCSGGANYPEVIFAFDLIFSR